MSVTIAGHVEDDWEPYTIPGKVVHDVLCLMAIIADWVECAVIVIWRLVIDVRHVRKTML